MAARRYLLVLAAFAASLAICFTWTQTAAAAAPQSAAQVTDLQDDSAAAPPQDAAPEDSAAPAETHRSKHDRESRDRDKRDRNKPIAPDTAANAVIWRMPENIAGLDLYYGQGGEKHQPQPPFTFLREDLHGSSPKCDVTDANRRKWRVKLGAESRPEVVASRLLWAVGYFVNDDYVVPDAQIRGLRMKRRSPQRRGTEVIDARFARKPGGQKKIGPWKWKDNPFFGTREFNGLRVMMAVLNSWDLKDDNNAVYEDERDHQQIYMVSDIGATFGSNGMSWSANGSKGNVEKYEASKFVLRNSGTEVDFATPAPPTAMLAESFGFSAFRYMQRQHLEWIGKNIPTPDAHWIGTLLGQLSHQQLVDAFRAGNFPPDEIESYVSVLQSRIEELKAI